MRTGLCVSPVAWLVLLAAWPAAASAQREPPPTGARLVLNVFPTGTTASLLLSTPPSDPAALERSLADTLGNTPSSVLAGSVPGAWQLVASFPELPARQGLSHSLALDVAPLRAELRRQGFERVVLSVNHPTVGFSEMADVGPAPMQQPDRVGYQRIFAEGDPPASLRLTYGYHLFQLWPFGVLAGLLLAAVGVTLVRRARALRESDAAAAWFRHWRGQRALGLGLWCAWLLALLALNVYPQISMLLVSRVEVGRWMLWALLLVPPALTLALCHVLSAAVYARVPAAGWSRRRVALQALCGQGAVVAVLLLVGWGADRYRAGDRSGAATVGAGAVAVAAVGYLGWRLARGRSVTQLPAGAVRDRLFAVAKGAATRVRQAYLLPGDCWRLLDVFARPGRSVHLATEAVDGMEPREVDAVVALELAYLRRQRGERLGLLLLTAVAAGVAVAVALGLRSLAVVWHEGVAYLVPLAAVGAVWLAERRPQRLGSALDARAARLTGDAEGLLAALARLERTGMLPPSSAGRLEALAARTNVTPERLRELRCVS